MSLKLGIHIRIHSANVYLNNTQTPVDIRAGRCVYSKKIKHLYLFRRRAHRCALHCVGFSNKPTRITRRHPTIAESFFTRWLRISRSQDRQWRPLPATATVCRQLPPVADCGKASVMDDVNEQSHGRKMDMAHSTLLCFTCAHTARLPCLPRHLPLMGTT